jgi:hypothetical protein
MPPIWFPGHLRARKIWIDDALGGAARCRLITLRQRGIGAFDVVPIYAVGLQADRIVRAISLGQGPRCRQNSDGRQNRQSPNGHLNLPRDGHSINAPKQTDHVSVNSHSRASPAGHTSQNQTQSVSSCRIQDGALRRAPLTTLQCATCEPLQPATSAVRRWLLSSLRWREPSSSLAEIPRGASPASSGDIGLLFRDSTNASG